MAVWFECVYLTLKLFYSACVEMYRGAIVNSIEALLSGMQIKTHSLLKEMIELEKSGGAEKQLKDLIVRKKKQRIACFKEFTGEGGRNGQRRPENK